MKIILLTLTCANQNEAMSIAHEILLFMESLEKHFNDIEVEVRKLRSYNIFVLLAQSITQYSKEVEGWIKESIG